MLWQRPPGAGAFLYGAIWSSGALVRPIWTFYGVLLCPTGQTELRRRDREKKKREKEFMLINREEWRREEENQISFMGICTGPRLSFEFILFFQTKKRKKRKMRPVFTFKVITGHARTGEWRKVNWNDISPTPLLIYGCYYWCKWIFTSLFAIQHSVIDI